MENTYSLGAFGYTHSVIQTSDGGYLYAGWEGIVKADSNGLEQWKNKNSELGLYPTYEDVIQHSNEIIMPLEDQAVDKHNLLSLVQKEMS